MNDERANEQDEEEGLVRFFRALGEAARREYEALAAKDRAFGEDVRAERRADDEARR